MRDDHDGMQVILVRVLWRIRTSGMWDVCVWGGREWGIDFKKLYHMIVRAADPKSGD